MEENHQRPIAIVTGASSGIGFELAVLAAKDGYDLVIAADEPEIFEAAKTIAEHGTHVEAIEADLASLEGNDRVLGAVEGRGVELLFVNAGRGLGEAFLDQDFASIRRVIDTNVTGSLYLIHKIARTMKEAGKGRVLITGSIAGFIPGTYQAVYNGTKAMLDSFAIALRAELKGSGVTVTNLMPGGTETEFFRRAHLLNTKLGISEKQAADEVARVGYEAMMRGEAQVISGWKNRIQTALAQLTPSTLLAELHRAIARPGSADASEDGTTSPDSGVTAVDASRATGKAKTKAGGVKKSASKLVAHAKQASANLVPFQREEPKKASERKRSARASVTRQNGTAGAVRGNE